MISTKKLLGCASLTALTLAFNAHPVFAQSSGYLTLNTNAAIVNGTGTNPLLAGGNGTGTPTNVVSGAANTTTATIGGTFAGTGNSSALYITGADTHGTTDNTTTVTVTGALTSGVGGGAQQAAILLDTTGGNTVVNVTGSASGAAGQAAIFEGASGNSGSNGGNITVNSSGALTAGAGAGTLALNGATAAVETVNITAGTVTQTGTGTTIELGNVANGSGDVINISGGTVSATAAAAAAIDVSAVTGHQSTINISGGAVTNLTGATGKAIVLGEAGSDTVVVTGGTITGTITTTTNNTGTVVFNDVAGFSTNGNIGTSAASELLAVNTTGGTVALNNNIFASSLGLNGGTVNAGANITTSAATINFGGSVVNLGTNTLTTSGATTLTSSTANSTLDVTLGATSNGKISSATNAITNNIVGGGHTVNVVITNAISTAPVATGNNEFVILHGTASTAGLTSTTGSNGGLVVTSLAGATSGTDAYGNAITGNNVVYNVGIVDAKSLAGVTQNEGNVVNAGVSVGAPASVKAALLALNAPNQVALAGARLSPETNLGSIQGSQAAVDGVLNTVANRLDALRGAPGVSGMSTGEGTNNLGLWMQGFGSSASQDGHDNAAGFDVYGGGLAIGADKLVARNIRMGASFAYARDQVNDTGNLDGNDMSIDSYLGTLYGSYQGAPWYVDGALDFGFHHYSTTRLVSFSGFNDTANGAHQGYQYTAKMIGGYPINLNPVTVTPILGFTYSHLDQTGYVESSNAGSGLRVGGLGNDSYKTALGGKVSETFQTQGFKLIPEFTAAWEHEFNDTSLQSTDAFAAGGASFTSNDVRPAADTALVGLNLTAKAPDDISLTASYTAEVRTGYLGNTGILQLRKDF